MSWYSIHSPIALEYLQMVDGRPPLRPLEDCDLPDRPCRWFIYKDPDAVRDASTTSGWASVRRWVDGRRPGRRLARESRAVDAAGRAQ